MNKETVSKFLFVVVILILVLVILYSGLQILESTVFFGGLNQFQTTSKTIIHNGVRYYPRQDITVLMILGINQYGKVVPTEYNHGGSADMITLLIFDEQTEECHVLSLNRDMMVDMPMLNEKGKQVGVLNAQLAYSHAYGEGMHDSCRNVRMTVSNLLYGLQIDYYVSLNMDAIAVLNDAVGGVKVTVVDDFSQVDPEIPMGEVVLFGQHAVNFVQARWDVGDQLNLSRMERHKVYMRGFADALQVKMAEDPTFVLGAYADISDYVVTDCSVDVLSKMQATYGDYSVGQVISLKGENVLGETYYEFYVDENALKELVIELLYSPK